MPMDVGVSASVDVNNCHGLCMYTLESTNAGTQDLSVNKLGNDVTEFLNIQDDRDGVPDSKPPSSKYEFQKKDEAIEKCFSKCTTSPCSKKTTSSAVASVEVALGADAITGKESTSHENMKSADPSCSRSSSLPAALKPVSAMKGSREKRGGTPPQKLTVKWAPDVYDPVPTSVSHTVTNNRPQKQSKKNSKSKQKKGSKSSSRGNKHKDKKQGRKRGGDSSNTSFNLPEHEEEEVVDSPPTPMDFHVGNPDQFCGSSFLKRYGRNMHLSSVAEATQDFGNHNSQGRYVILL